MIKAKMAQLGIENMSAYLRKMAIDGYDEKLDMPELREPKNPCLTFQDGNGDLSAGVVSF